MIIKFFSFCGLNIYGLLKLVNKSAALCGDIMVHQLHAIVHVVSCSFHSETLVRTLGETDVRLVLGELSTL